MSYPNFFHSTPESCNLTAVESTTSASEWILYMTRSPISALRSQRCVIFGPTALPLSRGTHTEILRTRYFTLVVTRPLSYLVEEQICRLRRPHGANPRLAPSHHLFLRWQLGEETRQSSHKPTPTLFTSQGKRNHKRASVNLSVCWGHSFISPL